MYAFGFAPKTQLEVFFHGHVSNREAEQIFANFDVVSEQAHPRQSGRIPLENVERRQTNGAGRSSCGIQPWYSQSRSVRVV